MTKAEGLTKVESLINDFGQNEKHYLSKDFQETEARNRFIDPFFEALGWDFHQTSIHKNEWDVHREFSQRDNSSTKKPDYAFRAKEGRTFKVKFFVEAKAPWVNLRDHAPVYQAKRYAFSSHGKTPIVILTDFQELRVFNGLEKPVLENPLQGLISGLDFKYTNYIENWDTIWSLFSKESVTAGSINTLVGKVSKKTKTLDEEFLSDISEWREILARNVAIRNKELKVDELNEAVQRIIDRFVFIRNLEDREIETEGTLFSHINIKENIYAHLIPLFRDLDADYNGLLFKKHFSEDLIVDDKVIKELIKNMCYPLSPYQFDEIEPEILGRIYEKFLGSKIRLTDGHQAKVEEKPEVRHAGGVFYTPQYIVDYIVKNTLGEVINNVSPDEIKKIRVCDPACGSGSFLLGAFEYLMQYHLNYYSSAPVSIQKKYKEDFYYTADKEIKLSLKKRSEILQNNIFGVDIDREATEVAIMSLYLKLLDDGFDKGQVELFMKGHILPDMTGNIKCGNSLISRDSLYENDMFGDNDINPFDWKNEYNAIFIEGGFDVILGNPPYIKTQEMQKYQPKAVEIFKNTYSSASKGNFDIYILFIEKASSLVKEGGKIGYICPHKFFNSGYGENIRNILSNNKLLHKILHFGVNQIFKNATTYTCLLFLNKESNNSFNFYEYKQEVSTIEEDVTNDNIPYFSIASEKVSSDNWTFMNAESNDKMEKICNGKPLLEELVTNIFQGPKAGADPVFILKCIKKTENGIMAYSNSLDMNIEIETSLLHPYRKGKNIKKNHIITSDEYIVFPYTSDGTLVEIKEIEHKYPLTYSYLVNPINKNILLAREEGRFKKIWWSYSRPQNMKILFSEKILTPFNSFSASYAYDTDRNFIFSAGVSGAYGIVLKNDAGISYEYLTALLNSTVLDNYLKAISTALRGGYYSYENKYIKQLPIFIPNKKDKDKYALCMKIEEMQKKIISERTMSDKDRKFLESKIDELVEVLYL